MARTWRADRPKADADRRPLVAALTRSPMSVRGQLVKRWLRRPCWRATHPRAQRASRTEPVRWTRSDIARGNPETQRGPLRVRRSRRARPARHRRASPPPRPEPRMSQAEWPTRRSAGCTSAGHARAVPRLDGRQVVFAARVQGRACPFEMSLKGCMDGHLRAHTFDVKDADGELRESLPDGERMAEHVAVLRADRPHILPQPGHRSAR